MPTATLRRPFWPAFLLTLLALLLPFTSATTAQVTYPVRIGPQDFIADTADLITAEDEAKIRATCTTLLAQQHTPLIVVTINSMGDYGARNWPIERYAMNLFDEWGIGHADRNAGVLLLVSKNDRKVRIEMGAAFTHARDVAAAGVINGTIVPQFKSGNFSKGIQQGVDAIAKRVVGAGVPSNVVAGVAPGTAAGPDSAAGAGSMDASSPRGTLSGSNLPKSLFGPIACFVIPIILFVVIAVISRVFRSSAAGRGGVGYGGVADSGPAGTGYGPAGWGGGWGKAGGGLLGGLLLGGLLGNAWGSRSHTNHRGGFGGGSSGGGDFGGGGFTGGGGGGGFSGGSFGGGFSGGGGATGSW